MNTCAQTQLLAEMLHGHEMQSASQWLCYEASLLMTAVEASTILIKLCCSV
jgi:hypothetical protein